MGAHGAQTAKMLAGIERILLQQKPDFVLVQGDTNSALAGALAAAKLDIPVVHLEAGCRSYNRAAPEEVNRVLIDHVASLHLAPDAVAVSNLAKEGIVGKTVKRTGNTSLDAALRMQPRLESRRLGRFHVAAGEFALATVHRAENTNDPRVFASIVAAINAVARELPVVLPLHPRTAKLLRASRLKLAKGVVVTGPLGFTDFLTLLSGARFAMSDSGGVQEEAAVVNTPCLILREETEWTRLVRAKKNFLVGTQTRSIVRLALALARDDRMLARVKARKAPLEFGSAARVLKELALRFGR